MEKNLDLEGIRPSVAEPERKDAPPVVSMESIDSFRCYLESNGRTEKTITTYQRCLKRLYDFLPDGKEIDADILRQWLEAMRTEGRSVGALNTHLSATNSYLDFLGRKELRLKLLPHRGFSETSALTWPEYLRALQTARVLGNKRAEMLVKLFCETGIRLRETSNVTLEAVDAGEIVTGSQNFPKRVPLPSELRQELRDYADSLGIQSGPLFVKRSGEPLEHSQILPMIVKLFKKAGIPKEKATVKTLRLFNRDWTTRDRIHAEVAEQVKEIYESLLSRGRPFST